MSSSKRFHLLPGLRVLAAAAALAISIPAVIKDNFPWNPFDEVNQAFGLRGILSPDPVAFYRSQANWLKLSGR